MSYFSSYPSAAPPLPSGRPEPQQRTPAEDICEGSCCLLFGGMAQILLGIVAIALGAVVITIGELGLLSQIYIPIWGGTIFMIAGAVGVASICIPSWKNCMMGFYVVFTAGALLVALGLAGWEGFVASQFSEATTWYCDLIDALDQTLQDLFGGILGITCDDVRLVYYMRIASSAIGGVEAIVALVCVVHGCMRILGNQDDHDQPDKMTMAGQTNYGADPYAQNTAFGQTASFPSYPTNTVTSFPAGTMSSFPAGQMSSYPHDTMASYSASRYMRNPGPGPGPAYSYNGYPQSSNVYYDGGKASYRSSRYM